MTNPKKKLKNHKSLLIVGIVAGIIIIPLVVYIAFLLFETGNLYHFGEPFYFRDGRLYFGPSSCEGENQRLQCSVTGDPYSWCSCESRVFDNNGRGISPGISPALKPIIYLYPETETELTVKLGKPESLTASYPAYTTGWHVFARPDGTLTDLDTGRELYSLYWEGETNRSSDFPDGFVVTGAETIPFLEEKLAQLGLNGREAEEFIVYWLPKMQNNPYNLIRFKSLEEINEDMPLDFSVEPDTLIRVLMVYQPLAEPVEISPQLLPETPARNGFTIVEWGGSEIAK